MMTTFGEKYGYPILGRACYKLISSRSEDLKWYNGVLSDIKQILETTPLDERMYGFSHPTLLYLNGRNAFEMVIYWNFVNRNAKPSIYTDDMMEKVLLLLVENGAGNIHDAINAGCANRVRELIAEGLDLNWPSWETIPWQRGLKSSWLPLEHAIDIADSEIIALLARAMGYA